MEFVLLRVSEVDVRLKLWGFGARRLSVYSLRLVMLPSGLQPALNEIVSSHAKYH